MKNSQEFKQAYQIKGKIGGGGFGNVYEAIDKRTGKTVAIKHGKVSARYTLKGEVEIALKVGKHPNLIEYHGVYRFTEDMGQQCDYAVMEYCNGGTFDDFAKRLPNRKQIDQVLEGILNGLEHLHEQGIIHEDIRPSNIVLHEENGVITPKLINFSSKFFSKERISLGDHHFSYKQTVVYMSPEQLWDGTICNGTDLWALGIMLHLLFTGKHPYAKDEADSRSQDIVLKNINKGLWSGNLPNYIDKIPQPYREVVYKTLIKDTSERARSVQEIKAIISGAIRLDSSITPKTETEIIAPIPVPPVPVKKAKSNAIFIFIGFFLLFFLLMIYQYYTKYLAVEQKTEEVFDKAKDELDRLKEEVEKAKREAEKNKNVKPSPPVVDDKKGKTAEELKNKIDKVQELIKDVPSVKKEEFTEHVVQVGETLYSIAQRYGVNEDEIKKANGFDKNTSLIVGKTLKIPKK